MKPALHLSVSVQTEPSFIYETPEILFEGAYFAGAARTYDVDQDGQRFLMIMAAEAADDASTPASLILVQNWFEELRQCVPVP